MPNSKPSKGVASLLASIPIIGTMGVDKFYAGATSVGLIQLILSITIVGLLVSVPWSWISAVVLIIASLTNAASPVLYPNVDWDTSNPSQDHMYSGIAIAVLVLVVLSGGIGTSQTVQKYSKCKKSKDKYKKK